MAPNQKRAPLHLTTVDLSLVQPGKSAFPPLTSEVPSTAVPAKSVVSEDDTTSDYWAWSSENDAEINKIVDEERLSADHIVDNILRQPAVAPSNATCASNDQYWDWSHAKNESTNYWNWETTTTNDEQIQSTVDSDSYWAW